MHQRARMWFAEFNHPVTRPAQRRVETENDSVSRSISRDRRFKDGGGAARLASADARGHLMKLLERNAHARHCANVRTIAKAENWEALSGRQPGSIEAARKWRCRHVHVIEIATGNRVGDERRPVHKIRRGINGPTRTV